MSDFETKHGSEQVTLAGGMVRDSSASKLDYTLVRRGPMYQRWVELLNRGAAHYGKNNWCKALTAVEPAAREETKERFRESALRHFEQWLAGDRTEDHAAAVMFNINGYEAMLDTDPKASKHRLDNFDINALRKPGERLEQTLERLKLTEQERDAKLGPTSYPSGVKL